MELTVFHSERKDDDEIEVYVGAGDVGGGVVGGGLDGDGVAWSFLRNVSRRFAFLLMVDGLGFFLVRDFSWFSEAMEKEQPGVK